jgi:hypothetical protein
MRRNCSHCDIEQQLEEEKLGAGWLFVKCHLCGETSTFSGEAWKKALEMKFERTLFSETITEQLSVNEFQFEAPAPKKLSLIFPIIKTRGILRSNFVPIALALVCVGSGFYILDSVNKIKESNAIAVVAETVEQKTPEKTASVEQSAVNRSPAIVDRIDLPTQAAPVPPAKDLEKAQVDSPAIITVKAKLALLRSGPGQGYAALGNVSAPEKLILKGSKIVENQNWLQVQTAKGLMWIRADLVNQSGHEGSAQ